MGHHLRDRLVQIPPPHPPLSLLQASTQVGGRRSLRRNIVHPPGRLRRRAVGCVAVAVPAPSAGRRRGRRDAAGEGVVRSAAVGVVVPVDCEGPRAPPRAARALRRFRSPRGAGPVAGSREAVVVVVVAVVVVVVGVGGGAGRLFRRADRLDVNVPAAIPIDAVAVFRERVRHPRETQPLDSRIHRDDACGGGGGGM